MRQLLIGMLIGCFALASVAYAGDHRTGNTAFADGALRLEQAAGEDNIAYDAASDLYFVDADQDGTRDSGEEIINPRHVLNAEEFLAGGTDYGAAITAAFQYLHDTLSPTNTGGVIELPRGQTLSVATPIDWCDETGRNDQLGNVTLIGRGSNRGGQNATRLLAAAGLADQSARTGATTLSLAQDSGTGGRDEITRASGSFLTDGFQHGDLVKIDGFDNSFDSDGGGAAILPNKLYVIFNVSALAMSVELITAQNAGFTAVSGGGNESVTELTEMFRGCGRKQIVRDLMFDGNSVADILIHAYSDNNVAQACTGPDAPLDECTGAGTASGLTNLTVKGRRFENVDGDEALVVNAIVRSATNTGGQDDRVVFQNVELNGVVGATETPVGLWVDNHEAQPVVLLRDSDIDNHGFRGIWVTAGGVGAVNTNIVQATAAGACRSDTYGACQAIGFGQFNLRESYLDHVALDIYESDGIVGEATPSSDTDQITFSMRDTSLNFVTLTGAASALTWDNEGALYVDEQSIICRQSGATTAPTVTIQNDDEATRSLNLYFNPQTNACAGGAVAVTYGDSVFNQAGGVVPFFLPDITTASDYMIWKAPRAVTLHQLDCVASGGSGLTTVDVTVNECSSAGATCATTGATATMTAVDTNVSDSSLTNASIDAGDWLQVATGTVTWTTPGHVQCALRYVP